MDGLAGALAMAAGGLAVAAVALARAGRRQRSYRGWHWWCAALGTGVLALACAAAAPGRPWAEIAVQTLLLIWAPMTLVGLRRFDARSGLPGHERTDAAVTALAILTNVWLPGAASLLVQGYVGAILWGARQADGTGGLRLIGALVALAAWPSAISPWAASGPDPLAQAGVAGLALLAVAFTTLTLMNERTERELRESRRRLRVLANTDTLTGVSNRRHFHDLATRALQQPVDPRPVLLAFDIDHFKLINDRLGHPAGDRALRLVGRCMQEALRARDLAGRLGGDEFALLLHGATPQQAVRVAQRIVMQLQTQSAAHRLPVLTLSFGVVQVQTTEGVDDALRRADLALYEAKRQGRSRAVTAQGDDERPVFSESERLGLTSL